MKTQGIQLAGTLDVCGDSCAVFPRDHCHLLQGFMLYVHQLSFGLLKFSVPSNSVRTYSS